jgi:TP901 family phage tail tape measure protein
MSESNILRFGVGVDLSELTTNTNRASSQIENFANSNQKRLDEFGKKATELGDKFKVLSGVLTAFGGVALFNFGQIDKSLREVNSLFGLTGDAAEKNFGDLVKISKEASNEVGILQQDISKGLYDAISAGVPKENAFDFIITASKASIGGVTDLKTSVDGLTTIINAYGKDFSEVGAVADSVFAAIQGGKTTFEELASSIFNIAPAAAAAKVSMEEVNAGIATLTASGTPTSVATTQIRAALVGLQRPSEELDSIFKKLGFNNAQLAIESKGLKFALDAVKDASGGNNGALQELLGSVEAVAAVNVLAGTSSEKFSQELERQANAAGAAENAYLELEKSFPRQLERLKVQFANIAVEVGQRLAPLVSALASGLSLLSDAWNNLDESTKDIIVVIGLAVAAFAPLALIVGKLIALAPALGAAWATITGPIGLIVAGVVAFTVAVVKNWDTVKQWAEDVANYFILLYNESLLFRAGIELIVLSFKNIFSVGKFVFTSLAEIIIMSFNHIFIAIKSVGDLLLGILTFDKQRIKDAISNGFTDAFDNVKKSLKKLGDNAVTLFEDVSSNATDAFNNIMKNKIEPIVLTINKDKLAQEANEAGEIIQSGLSGGGRARVQGVGSIQGAGFANIDTSPQAKMGEILQQADTSMLDFYMMIENFSRDVEGLVAGSIADTFTSLGESIGEAMANGGNVFSAIGKSLLQSVAKFVGDMGKLLVQYGTMAVLKGKLDIAIATGGATAVGAGLAAIAAGVALTAISSAIGSRASGGLSGGSVGTNSTQQPQSSVSSSTFMSENKPEVVFRISGQDLIGVLRRVQNNENRLG